MLNRLGFQPGRGWSLYPRVFHGLHFLKRNKLRCSVRNLQCAGASQGSLSWEVTKKATDLCYFLRNLASVEPPKETSCLLWTLLEQKKKLMDPLDRSRLHPFLIPLAIDEDTDRIVGFLRWPTPPSDMPLPIVEAQLSTKTLVLLSNSAKAYIQRYLTTLEAEEGLPSLHNMQYMEHLYTPGSFSKSGLSLQQFLIRDIGPFPDVYEQLTHQHLEKGRTQSALITCEKAAVSFPGWGRSRYFHSRVLRKLNRMQEARDAARAALQLPLWTLNDDPFQVGFVAGFQSPETSFPQIYRKLANDKRQKDIENGKPKEQVALDRAAFLLDVTFLENNSYQDIKELLAQLYEEAKLPDIARFVAS
ncbi:hypothetical protein GpartN1_g3555.t1 [Galdieria partita]|uniref:Uncharacterized protein n=1 Tax=Galdieria partita TaxID=83374 RepID=A0A9C7PX12_9RHOD|nr:hypothetical protein GpartN1_g3555.t1 [Galdieria partita]